MYPVLHQSRQNNVVGEQLPSPQRAFILAHETSVPGCATVFTDSICSVARYVPATFSTTQTTFRSRDTPSYRDVQLWIFKRRFNGQQITNQIYLKILDMIFISLKFLETKNSKNWSFKIISPTSLYRDRFIKEINIILNNEHAGSLLYSLQSKEIYLIVAWGNASMYRFTWYNVNYWRIFLIDQKKNSYEFDMHVFI